MIIGRRHSSAVQRMMAVDRSLTINKQFPVSVASIVMFNVCIQSYTKARATARATERVIYRN
jgi:hypothetical protein